MSYPIAENVNWLLKCSPHGSLDVDAIIKEVQSHIGVMPDTVIMSPKAYRLIVNDAFVYAYSKQYIPLSRFS